MLAILSYMLVKINSFIARFTEKYKTPIRHVYNVYVIILGVCSVYNFLLGIGVILANIFKTDILYRIFYSSDAFYKILNPITAFSILMVFLYTGAFLAFNFGKKKRRWFFRFTLYVGFLYLFPVYWYFYLRKTLKDAGSRICSIPNTEVCDDATRGKDAVPN